MGVLWTSFVTYLLQIDPILEPPLHEATGVPLHASRKITDFRLRARATPTETVQRAHDLSGDAIHGACAFGSQS